ncbi:MAG: STAS/SEC14 domain-containing protein [Candidatus Eiseniibacteriota bacterium]
MPVTLTVDHEKQETITVATGSVTMADIRKHLDEETRARGLTYRELIDGTKATAAFNGQDARAAVEILRALGRSGALGPTAVLVANDVSFGMMRMLEMLLEDVCDVRAFRPNQREEAEAWLASTPVRARAQGPA